MRQQPTMTTQELSEPLARQPKNLSYSNALSRSSSSDSIGSSSSPPKSPGERMLESAKKPIGVLHFAAITYFLVAGGPFGIEYAVIYGGPLLALIGLVVLPLVWSIPQAIMTAELSTALPNNGGYVVWAQYTFGDFFGFIAGVNGIISSLVDSTLYPTLLATYVMTMVGDIERGGIDNSTTTAAPLNMTTGAGQPDSFAVNWVNTAIGLSCVVIGLIINISGVEMVSVVSMVCIAVIMIPFFIYFFFMAHDIFSWHNYTSVSQWPVTQLLPWDDVQLGALLSTLIWSYTGYDTVGCLAGEVKTARRTFIAGSLITVFFVILTYSLPIVAMIMVHPDLSTWTDGVLITFLNDVGLWLVIWGVAGAGIQNLATCVNFYIFCFYCRRH